ncbi:hypothetical protein C8J56DRAFT_814784 [Mycena floridula]|nr:hypothetical protein C8J56DRAFT_814784 [Mycena floridula]
MLSIRPLAENIQRPLKTPGRGRQNENATRKTPGTNLKNRDPKTPYLVSDAPGKVLDGIQLKVAPRTASRPFLDKTPFPNRTGNATQFQTPYNQTNLDFGGSPDSALRPSSLRKHIRVPRGSLGKAFETPANRRDDLWDNISDISLSMPETEEEGPAVAEFVGDDFDEIEYMPPNNFDLPHYPPFDFDLPDYKHVGQALASLAYSQPYLYDAEPPAELEMVDIDVGLTELPVQDIVDDDPFLEVLAKPAAKIRPGVVTKAPAARAAIHSRTQFVALVKPKVSRPVSVASSSRTPTTSTFKRPLSVFNPSRTTTNVAEKPVVKPVTIVRKTTSRMNTANTTPAVQQRKPFSVKPVIPATARGTKPTPVATGLVVPAATMDLDDDFLFNV